MALQVLLELSLERSEHKPFTRNYKNEVRSTLFWNQCTYEIQGSCLSFYQLGELFFAAEHAKSSISSLDSDQKYWDFPRAKNHYAHIGKAESSFKLKLGVCALLFSRLRSDLPTRVTSPCKPRCVSRNTKRTRNLVFQRILAWDNVHKSLNFDLQPSQKRIKLLANCVLHRQRSSQLRCNLVWPDSSSVLTLHARSVVFRPEK